MAVVTIEATDLSNRLIASIADRVRETEQVDTGFELDGVYTSRVSQRQDGSVVRKKAFVTILTAVDEFTPHLKNRGIANYRYEIVLFPNEDQDDWESWGRAFMGHLRRYLLYLPIAFNSDGSIILKLKARAFDLQIIENTIVLLVDYSVSVVYNYIDGTYTMMERLIEKTKIKRKE